MPDCSRCQGEGEETYDEDGRTVTDVCYHCAGSGKVDDDTHFHDRLEFAASTIAHVMESDYRRAVNSDPDGDGYDLGGYENGMMPHDYFRSRVWDRTYDILEKLSAMSQEDQEFLVAWEEYIPVEPILDLKNVVKAPEPCKILPFKIEDPFGEDDIPF